MQHLMAINSLYCSTVQVFFPPGSPMLSCNDVRGTHTSASLGTPASQVCTVVILANCLTLLFSAQLGVSPGAPQKTLEKGHTLRELGVWTTFWSCKC